MRPLQNKLETRRIEHRFYVDTTIRYTTRPASYIDLELDSEGGLRKKLYDEKDSNNSCI